MNSTKEESSLQRLKRELISKERTTKDLIRFLNNQTDKNPNYSLLMGAGCSITSGIRSGEHLIGEWKKELYESSGLGSELSMDEFLRREGWYNDRNPYSSLFEKKFDLPRQRRAFIEKEVRNTTPSIGYAYLMRLVENTYINTIFTTNFDDLLNEAFYQYSDIRPIVCAHDSAINSITVTSQRPKIIKLHGDYLFDDIKSTLRETESLEDNIKNKFVEFAKDYGLIVMGYAGNDRSIVDILSYLLKSEDYFKHGIYWCLRPDSEINDDLRKLLWKDRVYFVIIDGFDELMAELNFHLNKGGLPIDNNILTFGSKQKQVEKLTTNPYLEYTNSEIIKKDNKALLKTLHQNIIDEFYNYMSSQEKGGRKGRGRNKGFKPNKSHKALTNDDKEKLGNIEQKIISEEYDAALSFIDEILDVETDKTEFRSKLLERKAYILEYKGKDDETYPIYKELIEFAPTNINHYIDAINSLKDIHERLKCINEALKINEYSAQLYWIKARIIFGYLHSDLHSESEEFTLLDVMEALDSSILLDPGVDNSAWNLKAKVLIDDEYDSKKETQKSNLESLLKQYEKQNIFHPNYITNAVKLLELKEASKDTIYQTIIKSIDYATKSDNGTFLELNELLLIDFYIKNSEEALLKQRFSYLEQHYQVSNEYFKKKSEAYLKVFDELATAITILEQVETKDDEIWGELAQLYMYNEENVKARDIKEKYLPEDNDLEFEILICENRIDDAITLMNANLSEKPSDKMNVVRFSYILLKAEKYKECLDFTLKHLIKCQYKDYVLLINHYIAEKMHTKKVPEKQVKQKIIEKGISDETVLACSYAILNDKVETMRYIKKALSKNSAFKYSLRDWPAFDDIRNDPQFIALTK